ncbi:hypothetical protein [Oceanobacillus bengalensis]|uniref:DUF4878 domain-containing protein n=1 Tax=Oceanobacillus bengalensis TaxID=1435466 RepID=A0A494Z2F3_9BACI|nr:hypothetical protein [Oceanobacillus bengalensis]RKQ16581.1 hypothetical protein D8M05_06800 [Oceanobacillus bengalensis]
MYRNRNSKKLTFFLLIIILLSIIVFIFSRIIFSDKSQAERAVEKFYEYEQAGMFSESWEMFHPYMQEKFTKGDYIEDRPHVFFNHFGVSSFSFSIDDVDKVKDWFIEDVKEPIALAYEMTVYQRYKGKYGNMTIYQSVYATEVDGEWKILWDYN